MNTRYATFLLAVFISICKIEAAGLSEQERQLLSCAYHNDLEGVIRPIINKVNVNVQDKNGTTALIFASYYKHENIVKFLLQVPGIDVNIQNNSGHTALMFAAHVGHENIVRLILQSPAAGNKINIQDKNGISALSHAVMHENIFNLLSQVPGVDFSEQWFQGAIRGHLLMTQKLAPKVDLNGQYKHLDGSTALILASQLGRERIVEHLLQLPGININARNNHGITALMLAARNGQLNILKLLLNQENIDFNAQDIMGQTALMNAAGSNSVQAINLVKILLEVPGININAQDLTGKTALIHAIISGTEEVAKILLKIPGININAETDTGERAFMLALIKKKYDISSLILNKTPKLAARAFKAVAKGDALTLKKLIISLGPDLTDAIGVDGDRLLHKAFLTGQTDIIMLLLRAAQDVRESLTQKNKNNQMALELISPSSPAFLLCLDLAYAQEPGILSRATNFVNSLLNIDTNKSVNACAHCSFPNCINRCIQCKKVYYCSPECQKEHWKAHKFSCKPEKSKFLMGLL